MLRFILALCLAVSASAAGGHDGHDHGETDYAFEWAGNFDVKEHNTLQWVAQKVDGGYADEKMAIVVLAAISDAEVILDNLYHTKAEALLEEDGTTCVDTPPGLSNQVEIDVAAEKCYKLVFDVNSFQSTWTIDTSTADYIAVFTEHVPTEFEDTTHYLRATDGTDIEPIVELPEEEEPDKPWLLVMLSCLAVNAMTFFGVLLMGCKIIPKAAETSPMVHGALSGFASGALMACAVFLILVEAMHLIAVKHPEESETVWRWGASFLGGMLIAPVLYILGPTKCCAAIVSKNTANPAADAEKGEGVTNVEVTNNKLMTTLFSVCMGDFAHNIVDGFAIGFAFKQCDETLAWTITAATIYHELAQEIGDFAILTHDIGLSVKMALFWNFLAGTSVIIGGAIAVAVDISDETTGILLAYGAGSYVYLAAVEALPRAFAYSEKLDDQSFENIRKHYSLVLSMFILSAVMIGLVLIKHEHCVPGGGEHAH